MFMRLTLAAAAAVAATAAGAPAQAQVGNSITTTAVNMRSGPDTSYPPVTVLPAGSPVTIYGCINRWLWCDAQWGPYRGWVAGLYLTASYDNRPVPFVQYAPRANIPIVQFTFGNYWDSHYRGRPFYRERNRWDRWDHERRRWR